MKLQHRLIAVMLSAGLAIGAGTAYAAPQLSLTSTTCTIQKFGSQYLFRATGTYTAASSSDVSYKINGYRATLSNFGGQNLRDTGLVAIEPTYLVSGQVLWQDYVSYRYASSLKNVTYRVYNGGSKKGEADAVCQRIGW